MAKETLIFSLPTDQEAFETALEGRELREIIKSIDHYLSIFHPENRIKVGAVRRYLYDLIKSKNLNCLKIAEMPGPGE